MLAAMLSGVFAILPTPPHDLSKGFVQDERTAIALGRVLLTSSLGSDYVYWYEPLYATKVMGRWIIKGRGYHLSDPGYDFNFEPYMIAIDAFTGGMVLFGRYDMVDVKKQLARIKP